MLSCLSIHQPTKILYPAIVLRLFVFQEQQVHMRFSLFTILANSQRFNIFFQRPPVYVHRNGFVQSFKFLNSLPTNREIYFIPIKFLRFFSQFFIDSLVMFTCRIQCSSNRSLKTLVICIFHVNKCLFLL